MACCQFGQSLKSVTGLCLQVQLSHTMHMFACVWRTNTDKHTHTHSSVITHTLQPHQVTLRRSIPTATPGPASTSSHQVSGSHHHFAPFDIILLHAAHVFGCSRFTFQNFVVSHPSTLEPKHTTHAPTFILPGVDIFSACAADRRCGAATDATYTWASGTSMAVRV